MGLRNQFIWKRYTSALFVVILFGGVFTATNAQIDIFNPCIVGETEEDSMGFFGIWKGNASYGGPFGTIWSQDFEFRLQDDGTHISGEGLTVEPYFGGLAKFEIEGTISENGIFVNKGKRTFMLYFAGICDFCP